MLNGSIPADVRQLASDLVAEPDDPLIEVIIPLMRHQVRLAEGLERLQEQFNDAEATNLRISRELSQSINRVNEAVARLASDIEVIRNCGSSANQVDSVIVSQQYLREQLERLKPEPQQIPSKEFLLTESMNQGFAKLDESMTELRRRQASESLLSEISARLYGLTITLERQKNTPQGTGDRSGLGLVGWIAIACVVGFQFVVFWSIRDLRSQINRVNARVNSVLIRLERIEKAAPDE